MSFVRPSAWRAALIVARKELVESLRDRRALIHTLLTGPLLAPLVFALIIHVMVNREVARAERPLPVPVQGADLAPGLVAFLRTQNADIQAAPSDPETAVRRQEVDLVLRIGPDFAAAWKKGVPAPVEIVYDASQRDSAGPVSRLRTLLDAYGRQAGALRLLARGVPPTVVTPLRVAAADQSTAQERSGILFGLLPYFFILGGFVGGMALAIDATAGERERQSLEPLLATPTGRQGLVLGKVAATVFLGLSSVLVGLAAFALVAPTLPVERLGMVLSLGAAFVAQALLILVPLVLLMATLQNAVSALAQSHREAQTYLSLLMFLPSLPSMMLAVLPIKATPVLLSLPVVGQQMLLIRALKGESFLAGTWLLNLSATVVLAALALALTVRRYRSERLASG